MAAATKSTTTRARAAKAGGTRAVKATAKKTAKRAQATKRAATKTAKTAKRAVKKSAPAAKKRTGSPRRGAQDAIALLKDDHRHVEALFKRFERAGANAHRAKRQLVDEMIEALARHAGIEEHAFYPAVRAEVSRASSDVLEALEEHHVAKLLLRELEGLDARAERFDAKVTVLIENVRHHVREEERGLFPKVRAAISRARLVEIGEDLRAAKTSVPTRPHPHAPDEPPANLLVDSATAFVDGARKVGKRAVDRVRSELP